MYINFTIYSMSTDYGELDIVNLFPLSSEIHCKETLLYTCMHIQKIQMVPCGAVLL